MSEIFAPGSVAGPAGPTGAAGSQGSVTALASSSLPSFVGVNLFDHSKITPGLAPSGSDGTLISAGGGATNCTALIYCPGATSMVSDLPVDGGNWSGEAVCLYDANGGFISAIPTSEYTGHTPVGNTVASGFAFALPGTQVYVRFGYVTPYINTNGWVATEAQGRVYATITGTATLPGTYAPPGLATTAAMNSAVATAETVASVNVPGTLFKAAIPGLLPNFRNGFDYTKVLNNMQTNGDGTLSANSGTQVGRAYCPGATSAITNIGIICGPYGTATINLFDGAGNFLGSNDSLIAPYTTSNRVNPNTAFPLPGTQAYIEFTIFEAYGSGNSNSLLSSVFFSGTTAAPPPSSLYTAALVPFDVHQSPLCRTATSLGATPDGFADSSAVLNAFLATASSANPIELILDGMFTGALVISPNGCTTIRGLGHGTGIQLYGSTSDVIRIGAYTPTTGGSGNSEGAYNTTLPSRSAVGICLRDFTVNASGQVNAGTNQPNSGDVAHGTYPIILANCSDVLIDNLNFPTYGANYCITLSNCDHVRVSNCVFNTTGYVHDGVHIDGPANDIGIENCDFTVGDDAIALNAPEGYGGDISRVSVTNCRFYNALSVMRIYTSLDPAAMPSNNVHKVRDVVVSNCTGSITNICFVLGIENGGLTSTSDVDQIQDLIVSNCTLSAPTNFVRVRDNIGSISMNGVKFIPTTTNPVFDMAYTTGELSLTDFTILRNPNGSAASDVVSVTGAVDKLSLVHCRVTDEEGSSYTPMSSWVSNGGTVSNLRLEAVDMTHMANLTGGASWTGFTSVKGSGVLGTGVQVPDGNMDNNALYLSSTASGAPSIKVGGTAKRFTLA